MSKISFYQRPLNSILIEAKSGIYELPDFQRDYKWKDTQETKLFDSIFSDFPIGSILLFEKPDNGQFPLATKKLKTQTAGDVEQLIMDGQQRITTIARLFTKHRGEKAGGPSYYINVSKLFAAYINYMKGIISGPESGIYYDSDQEGSCLVLKEKLEANEHISQIISDASIMLNCIKSENKGSLTKVAENQLLYIPLHEIINDDLITTIKKAQQQRQYGRTILDSIIDQSNSDALVKVKNMFQSIKKAVTVFNAKKRNKKYLALGKVKIDIGEEFLNFLIYIEEYIISLLKYKISVIQLEKSNSLTELCRVFGVVNTQGTNLTPYEIIVSVLMKSGISLNDTLETKSTASWQKVLNLKKDQKKKILFLRTIVLNSNIIDGISLMHTNPEKLPQVFSGFDYTKFDINFKEADLYLNSCVDLMHRLLGVNLQYGDKLLAYDPTILVLTTFLRKIKYLEFKDNNSNESIKKREKLHKIIKSWYAFVAINSRYTEGTNKKIPDDIEFLSSWFSNQTIPTYMTSSVYLDKNSLFSLEQNTSFGKYVLGIMNLKDPVDFSDKSIKCGYGIMDCEIHHIYPEEMNPTPSNLTSKDHLKSVFNLTWITKGANNTIINNKSPKVYLGSLVIDDQTNSIDASKMSDFIKTFGESHYINEKCLKSIINDNYYEFLTERINAIFEDINTIFREAGLSIKIEMQ